MSLWCRLRLPSVSWFERGAGGGRAPFSDNRKNKRLAISSSSMSASSFWRTLLMTLSTSLAAASWLSNDCVLQIAVLIAILSAESSPSEASLSLDPSIAIRPSQSTMSSQFADVLVFSFIKFAKGTRPIGLSPLHETLYSNS